MLRLLKKSIKDAFPHAGIGADIIARFSRGIGAAVSSIPSTFFRELPITHFHVFPYSKEKEYCCHQNGMATFNTTLKSKGSRALISLGESKLQIFARQQAMRKAQVLFEQQGTRRGKLGGVFIKLY